MNSPKNDRSVNVLTWHFAYAALRGMQIDANADSCLGGIFKRLGSNHTDILPARLQACSGLFGRSLAVAPAAWKTSWLEQV